MGIYTINGERYESATDVVAAFGADGGGAGDPFTSLEEVAQYVEEMHGPQGDFPLDEDDREKLRDAIAVYSGL